MLKLSKAQYKQLCADCAAEMMKGSGHGGIAFGLVCKAYGYNIARAV